MTYRNDYPLVKIEREWLEAVEGLYQYDVSRYQDLLLAAIGKAAGEDSYYPVKGFSDAVCQQYWNMTDITIADRETKTPGRIRLKK